MSKYTKFYFIDGKVEYIKSSLDSVIKAVASDDGDSEWIYFSSKNGTIPTIVNMKNVAKVEEYDDED